jgi:hypothetical protein
MTFDDHGGDDDIEPIDAPHDTRLFPGDTGILTVDHRVALAVLVKGPMLTKEKDKAAWDALIADRRPVETRLSELFLRLSVVENLGIAMAQQADLDDGVKYPKLMQRQSFKLVESAVLANLRMALNRAATTGEDFAVVSLSDIQDEIVAYAQFRTNDEAATRRSVGSAMRKFVRLGFARELRGSDDRFIAEPILKVLFPAEKVQALLDALQSMIGSISTVVDDDTEGSADD